MSVEEEEREKEHDVPDEGTIIMFSNLIFCFRFQTMIIQTAM